MPDSCTSINWRGNRNTPPATRIKMSGSDMISLWIVYSKCRRVWRPFRPDDRNCKTTQFLRLDCRNTTVSEILTRYRERLFLNSGTILKYSSTQKSYPDAHHSKRMRPSSCPMTWKVRLGWLVHWYPQSESEATAGLFRTRRNCTKWVAQGWRWKMGYTRICSETCSRTVQRSCTRCIARCDRHRLVVMLSSRWSLSIYNHKSDDSLKLTKGIRQSRRGVKSWLLELPLLELRCLWNREKLTVFHRCLASLLQQLCYLFL